MTLHIRPEQPDDIPGIRAVNLAAFGTSAEANLVDALRQGTEPLISLVAEQDGSVVGHILFSPVRISEHPELRMMGLAPMAVVPSKQCQGIGSELVRDGLEHCRQLGVSAVVVVGHAAYYPRFGFAPASRFGLRCEHNVPDDAFMVLELVMGAVAGKAGRIEYHAAFRRV